MNLKMICIKFVISKSLSNFRVLEEMFNQPLYVIFRNLCLTPDSDATRQLLLSLIAEMCERLCFC